MKKVYCPPALAKREALSQVAATVKAVTLLHVQPAD